MSNRRAYILLVVVLLLAASLRLYQLSDRSLWFDEAFSLKLSTGFSLDELIIRTGQDVHPPLYYVALKAWTSVFGTSLLAIRGMSVIFGIATVGVMFFLCKELFRDEGMTHEHTANRSAIYATALLGISSIHVLWSQETRMYTLGTFLCLVSTWCLLNALAFGKKSRVWFLGYTVSAAAFLYTHNYALFTVFGQGIFLLTTFGLRYVKRATDRGLPGEFVTAASSVCLILWMYLPWVPTLIMQKRRVQADYWIQSINMWTLPDALYLLFNPQNIPELQTHGFSLLAIVLVVASLIAFCYWERTAGGWMVVLLATVPVVTAVIISLTSVSLIVPRHLIYSQMFLIIIIARLISKLPSDVLRTSVIGLLLLDGAWLHMNYVSRLNVHNHRGLSAAMKYVEHNWEEGDRIVVFHPCIYHAVRYYAAKPPLPRLYAPAGEITHYAGKPVLEQNELVTFDEIDSWRSARLWIIESTGYGLGYCSSFLPLGWIEEPDRHKRFQEVYFFQGAIEVSLCRRSVDENESPESSDQRLIEERMP